MALFRKRASAPNSTTRARFTVSTATDAVDGLHQLVQEGSTSDAAMRAEYDDLRRDWRGPGLVLGSLDDISDVLRANIEHDLAARKCAHAIGMTATKPNFSVQFNSVTTRPYRGVAAYRIWRTDSAYALFSSVPDAIVRTQPVPSLETAPAPVTGWPRTTTAAHKHGWAEELMEEHLAKVEQHTPSIAARAAWPIVRRHDVLAHVMSGDEPQWTTGGVGTRGAMFDGLYVAVSNVPTHRAEEIRALLRPDGYPTLLLRLIAESQTIEKRHDVVHWLLGAGPHGWVAHLLYMPPPNGIPLSWDKGVTPLLPWDLFSPQERPGQMRHEF